MNCNTFNFTRHAAEQMFQRKISIEDVKETIRHGEKIKRYSDDQPYPSYLMLYFTEGIPIHVVVAVNSEEEICIIVTAYHPSSDLWEKDFKTKK